MKINRYNQFINEKNSLNDERINEELGWKDILMGVALFAGTLGASQKAEAQKIVDTKGAQISSFLSKENEDEIIQQLQDAGYTKAAAKLKDNQVKYEDLVKEIGKKDKSGARYAEEAYKLPTGNLESLKNKLMSGFAITSAEKKILRDTIMEMPNPEITYDTITVNVPQDEMFASGAFELNPDATKAFTDSLTKMKDDGLIITKVTIESSTDKQGLSERLQKLLKSKGFTGDNAGLSNARNNSFENFIRKTIGDSVDIKKSVKSGQGTEEIEAGARYVKATFVCIRVNNQKEASPKMTVKETIKWILTVAKIVKVYDEYKPELPGSSSTGKGNKSHGHDVVNCPVW
jgi:hypothetical protein